MMDEARESCEVGVGLGFFSDWITAKGEDGWELCAFLASAVAIWEGFLFSA